MPSTQFYVTRHFNYRSNGWVFDSEYRCYPADGVTLVVINCMGSDGGQLKSKNGGMKLGEVFGHAMRAFHAEVAIGPETEVVFLVSEPNWSLPGTL